MSESLTFEPASHVGDKAAKLAPRRGLATLFKATMESLVAAQTTRFEDTGPLLYRFPPI